LYSAQRKFVWRRSQPVATRCRDITHRNHNWFHLTGEPHFPLNHFRGVALPPGLLTRLLNIPILSQLAQYSGKAIATIPNATLTINNIASA